MHLNLHKTFSTPHGGGGPGSGPVACKAFLEPFLPTPVLVRKRAGANADSESWETLNDGPTPPGGTPPIFRAPIELSSIPSSESVQAGPLTWDYNRPHSVGRVRAFYGNTGMFIRALAYILANGPDGLRQTTEDAVLNANYIRDKLEDLYELPYKTASMHEVVFSDKRQAALGVKTGDIAKRLIDYGFHPYTVSFPLIVHGALMIEPTESESLEELDLFIAAMRSIAKEVEESPDLVKTAPHSTRISRLDEVQAARKPMLRWRPTE
jgi:glycine dehydrogenase subunit 2